MTQLPSLVLVALVIGAMGAACGGDDGSKSTPAASTTARHGTTSIVSAVTPTPGAPDASAPSPESTAGAAPVDTSVAVTLVDYSVAADKPTVPAGNVRFIATNTSATQTHEFVVLKIKPDGSFDNVGEVKDIAPTSGGSIVVNLAPGAYQLACLITIGESGSTVDHYQQGMHTAFTVQ